MRSVLIASLRIYARRYVAAVLAVMIAVAFVVVTNGLTMATKAAISSDVAITYPAADLVVGDDYGISDGDVAEVTEFARTHGDRTTVVGTARVPVRGPHGDLGEPRIVGTVSTDPALRWQRVVDGRAPADAGEALVSASAAKADRLGVGDEVVLGGEEGSRVRIVGTAADIGYLGADLYVPWAGLSGLPGAMPDAVSYRVGSGSVGDRRVALADEVDAQVRSRADYVAARVVIANQGVDVLGYLLLLFAAIAGFAAVLVIANTFTILFAQRTRDLALLRCVGATRRQVVRGVRWESAVLAVASTTAGVLAGFAGAYLLAALIRALAGPERLGPVSWSPGWIVAAAIGGILATLGSAWWPTRMVVRVSPLAALRPEAPVDRRSRSGRLRIGLGVLIVVVSGALLAVAAASHAMALMLVAGMASFVGLLLLGPVIVPAMVRLAGRVLGSSGPAVRIAAANAVRNPRRSAATTASLLVGVTLAAAVLTGMASARDAVDAEMDAQHPVDLVLTTADGPVAPTTVRRVDQTPGVEAAVPVPGLSATTAGGEGLTVLAPSAGDRRMGRDASVTRARPGEVLVPLEVATALDTDPGRRLPLTVAGRTTTLKVRLVDAEWGDAVIVAPATLARLGGVPGDRAVWARAEPGTDAHEIGGELGAVAHDAGLDLVNSLTQRSSVTRQLDVLVWSVLGLLGVGVCIALVGIGSTVGLSVLERGREHALLRALGLTRRQLRRMLAAEGFLLSLVAGLLGTVVGATYGWVGVLTVVRGVVPDAPLVLPWGQLLGVLAVAAVAGLLACVLPARRAARVTPAAGLTLD